LKRTLDAPFLEIGFYFAAMTDADAFATVARTILARGSRFIGAEGWRGPGKRTQPFEWTHGDELQMPLSIGAHQLQGALEDPDLRIMEISFDHIIGISKAPERLEYHSVLSREASLLDRHPVGILAEGEPFSGPYDPDRGWKPGKKMYTAFRELVLALSPSYACINVEAATYCPTDLHQDPGRFADDFWVNAGYVGENGLAAIARLSEGAYQERIGDGLYVSTYKYWNPAKINMDHIKSESIATEVGKIIAGRRSVRTLH